MQKEIWKRSTEREREQYYRIGDMDPVKLADMLDVDNMVALQIQRRICGSDIEVPEPKSRIG